MIIHLVNFHRKEIRLHQKLFLRRRRCSLPRRNPISDFREKKAILTITSWISTELSKGLFSRAKTSPDRVWFIPSISAVINGRVSLPTCWRTVSEASCILPRCDVLLRCPVRLLASKRCPFQSVHVKCGRHVGRDLEGTELGAKSFKKKMSWLYKM